MCTLVKKTRRKSVTGYKLVVQHKETGEFYSGFTGQKYEIGKVALPPDRCKRLHNVWNDDLDFIALSVLPFYKKDYEGFTSVVSHIDIIRRQLQDSPKDVFGPYNPVIVKVKLSGTIYKSTWGTWNVFETFSGNNIVSMEYVEDF